MQIKLKVIPDSGPNEVYEFKDYGTLLEHIVNLPAPEDDHAHLEGSGSIDENGEVSETKTVGVECDCPPEETIATKVKKPRKKKTLKQFFGTEGE